MGIWIGDEIELKAKGIVVGVDEELSEATGKPFVKIAFEDVDETISMSVADVKRLQEQAE